MTTGRIPSVEGGIQPTIFDAAGDLLYASAADTPARLAIGSTDQVLKVSGGIPAWGAAPAASFVGASIYNTTSFSISNNTATRITMNSEFFDTDAFHDTSTNTARITIPAGKGGKYLVCMGGAYEASGTGVRAIFVYKNGSSFVELCNDTGVTGGVQTPRGSVIIELAVNDYIELFTQQTSGSTLTGYFREYEHPFQVQFLGA
jgi:hypothetical protein